MRTALRVLLSLVLAGAVLAGLLAWSGVQPAGVVAAAGSVRVGTLLAALGVLVALYAARAWRIRIVLPDARRPPAPALAAATAAWVLDAQVLPAKVGEATLVWHLGRLGVPAAEGFVALVVSRLLDLAVLLGAFGLAALGLGAGSAGERLPWLVPLGLALVPVAVALAAVVARGAAAWRPVPRALSRLAARARTGGAAARILARAHGFSVRVADALAAVGRRRRVLALLTSLLVWALVLTFYALLARGLGIDLGSGGLVFGASLAVLGGLVPASGFLGFGMLDVGWVAGFAVLGVPRELAVESGLAFHVLYLAGVGLLGVVGHLGVARARARTRRADGAAGPACGGAAAEPLDVPLDVPSALRAAYEAARYEVSGGEVPVVLRIGGLAPVIPAPPGPTGSQRAPWRRLAVITAWNPFSAPTSPEANRARQDELIRAVERAGRAHLPALGGDPAGAWSPEPSLAVLDPSDDELDEWMLAFGQNAVVVAAAGGACSLRYHPHERARSAAEGPVAEAAAARLLVRAWNEGAWGTFEGALGDAAELAALRDGLHRALLGAAADAAPPVGTTATVGSDGRPSAIFAAEGPSPRRLVVHFTLQRGRIARVQSRPPA